MIVQDFSESHVDRFNRIGGINARANFRWESKERNDPLPVGQPRLANNWILLVPCIRQMPSIAVLPQLRYLQCRLALVQQRRLYGQSRRHNAMSF